jgi:predicted alpha/beta hydrolase
MKPSRSQLVNLLIGKSILETIVVGTLAVVVWTKVFPPTFHGWGEAVSSQAIAGWAVNNAAPWERVEVQLFIDGKLYGSQVAQVARPDVVMAGWATDEWHGYNFGVTGLAPGKHEARVYALHRSGDRMTLQLLGDPIRFVVDHR